MTSAEVLVSRIVQPDFDIVRVHHVELLVPDLDAASVFYVDLLGLIVTERTADTLYLRGWEEHHHHSLVLREAPEAGVDHVAFLVRTDGDLDRIAATLAARGDSVAWVESERAQGRALRTQDRLGVPIEFFHEMEQAESQLQRFDLHRGAPVMRFDHVNFHVPRPEEAIPLWQDLGFRCSEYISTDGPDERITGAWLHRRPSVHDVAFTAGRGPRLHHTGLWVAETTAVLRACDQLAAAGHSAAIERGPGRHGVSNAFFVYLRDPAGHRIELYTSDYYTGDPDHTPLRWSLDDPRCRTFWGTRAPDSWYEESSTLIGADGNPVQLIDSEVDERTEIMT